MSATPSHDWTAGDLAREKLADLFAAPDCGVRVDPRPATDAAGKPVPGMVEWTVTVRATLPGEVPAGVTATGCTPVEMKDAIIRELVRAVKHLGAKSDLLGVACSYGETYGDAQVLAELREWNEYGHVTPDAEYTEPYTGPHGGVGAKAPGTRLVRYGADGDVPAAIVRELYRAVVLLGGTADLLGKIGSWGNSLPDDDVLAGLRAWNAAEAEEIRRRLGHAETAARSPGCTPAAAPGTPPPAPPPRT